MSSEHVMSFMNDLVKCDVEALRRWFTEKSVMWVPPAPPIEGQRRILAMFRLIFRKYSELHWKVTDIYQVQDQRFIYLTESWGAMKENGPYKNHIVTVLDFDAEGRIAFLSDYFKDTAPFNVEKESAP